MGLHDKLNPYPRGYAAVTPKRAEMAHNMGVYKPKSLHYQEDRVYYVAHDGLSGFSIDPFLRVCDLWSRRPGHGSKALVAADVAGATGTCYLMDDDSAWHLFMNRGWQPVESITTFWGDRRKKWTRFAAPHKESRSGNS